MKAEVTAPQSPVPSPSAWTPSPGASTESNWNKPIPKPTKPKEVTAVASAGADTGMGGLTAIIWGVLLVGLAGMAFAWWAQARYGDD